VRGIRAKSKQTGKQRVRISPDLQYSVQLSKDNLNRIQKYGGLFSERMTAGLILADLRHRDPVIK
jgi:hypothetical protein